MSRRYLLDTNTLGHLIYQRSDVPRRAKIAATSGYVIGTGMPVVGELYFGVEKSSSRDFSMKAITAGLRKLKLWPFDLAAAKEFGRIAAVLKARGRPMQVVDIQIAAIAMVVGAILVTSDSDLVAIPELPLENWAVPASPPSSPIS